jgi:predicted dehydrogenase
MRVAIVGCGLIGQKRSKALGRCSIVACADSKFARAQALAGAHKGAEAFADWRKAVELKNVDIVIVATTHDSLSEITLAAMKAGKHVLVEKPAARNAAELQACIEAERSAKVCVRVGFNHRYHRAFRKARELQQRGDLGQLMYIRGRYGHGGRLGYEKEWRANRAISGGGELIDQGVHLIDLSRWFLGDFTSVNGMAQTMFWPMQVEDNGFMMLQTAQKQVAFLHASCTEWKNLFSFEIFGRTGKLEISGLGGSYGVERLTFYKMLPEMGPPETTAWEYPMSDDSWDAEFAEFLEDIQLNRRPAASLSDAHAALTTVKNIYEKSGL